MAKTDLSGLDDQAIKDLASLALALAHDKDTRPIVNAKLKKDFNKSLPDVEIEDIRASVKKEFEDRDANTQKERTLAKLEAQKEELKSRYEEKDITEIEKLMEKHGLSDYSLGARLYAAETKPANPSYEVNDHKWSMPQFKVEDLGNLRQLSRAKAYQAIDEIRSKRAH